MVKKYEPAVFQPTIRPSWAGALEYIPNDELAQILKAITVYPLIDLPDSVFWNKTIKPDLEQQHKKFLNMCEDRGRGARSYWGEHKLSTSLPQGNLCKDKDKDKVKDKVNFDAVNSGIRNTRACNSDIPTIDEFLDYAKEQNELAGVGGFACTPEMADACYNYYTTNGWRRGNDANTPIRDWKAVLREWARTEQKNLAQEKGLATYYDKFYDWWNDKLRLKESELESPGHIKRFTAKSPERQRAFNQRWKETKAFLKQKGQNPTDDEIFDYMTKNVIGFNYINSPWLQGRITSDKYETPFEFNVDFVLRPSTWTKLLENYYVDKKFNMGD